MESKLIAIEEANRMLPLLRQIVRDIVSNWEQIIRKRSTLESLEKRSAAPSDSATDREEQLSARDREVEVQNLKQELNHLIDRINSYIREIEDLGCFVEEFKRGIINFPSLYNGRKVFLCWIPDENSVGYWHELDESFADRTKIQNTNEFLCQRPERSSER